MNELLVLVADKYMAEAVGGLMDRDLVYRIIACRPFDVDSRRDIRVAAGQNDPGLFVRANELLRPYAGDYRHVVVIVDEAWEGSPGAQQIETALAGHLADAGWGEDAGLGLVVCPEADVWLWSDSPHTATALGWGSWEALRPALEERGWLTAGAMKPEHPKEAAQWALEHCGRRMPRSSTLYRAVSSRASLKRCRDGALARLLNALRVWFPLEAP